MTKDVSLVRSYFRKLGMELEIADIYLALHKFGPQTISDLARYSSVERTRIYRLIDQLAATNLIEIETQYHRKILHAAPISNVQILLSKKEEELQDLHKELKTLDQTLNYTKGQQGTRVQYYRGTDGLKQMFWNQAKAKTPGNFSILYENMQNKTNRAFFERWVRKCNEDKNRLFHGIISDHFIASQQQWYGKQQNERLAHWQSRYISPDIFLITHSMVLYDNVTSYFNWKDGEIFGIEIYNQQIKDAQLGFFKLLWEQSRPVDDLKGPKSA
jgi:DNA-binding MarR family transcriptional regulator